MVADFFQEFFVKRILDISEGYNLIDTLVYALIALTIAFIIIYPLFNRLKVKFNFNFALALLPFIILGSAVRVVIDLYERGSLSQGARLFLEQIGVFPRQANPLTLSFYTVTPGIYIAVGVFAILALLFSVLVAKKLKVESIIVFGIIGFAVMLPVFAFVLLQFKNLIGFFSVIVAVFVSLTILYFVFKHFKSTLLESRLNQMAAGSQMLDGFATFFAIQFYGFGEQHVVSGWIINISPLLFPIIKIILILLILWFVDKDLKNENLQNFVKILIFIFGFAPGFRDLLTLSA